MDHPVSSEQKLKAVLRGSCVGTCIGILAMILVSGSLSFGDKGLHSSVCTPGAVIVTSFAPDIHC